MSKNEFAHKCEIPYGTMRGYIDGTSFPSPGYLEKIANAHNLTVGKLMAQKEVVNQLSTSNLSKQQIAKKESIIQNSAGSTTINEGVSNSLQLTQLERDLIEMNRSFGNDTMLKKFLANLEELKNFIEKI